uniref:Uncharacterized protein n=2 Tax=Timema TaxID=61471 RepID=A0A7R9ID41_9NEOP|nr:unnamed protein product [Timema bartmani]CAD7456521.1 unnamed protein product [Timema tahoe]
MTSNQKVPTHNEKFYHSSSLMHRFTTKNSREVHNIEECARRYIITGRPLPEMCDHNAAVAKDMGRNQISLLWSIVKTLYSTYYKSGEFGQQTPSGTASREDPGTLQEPLGAPAGDGDQCSLIGGGGDTPGAASAGEDDTETDETPEQHFNNGRLNLGGHFSSSGFVGPQGDFFFGDGELDPMGVEFDNCSDNILGLNISNMPLEIDNMDWTLPTEAFPLRHEIQDRSPPPEQFPNHGSPDLNEQGNKSLTLFPNHGSTDLNKQGRAVTVSSRIVSKVISQAQGPARYEHSPISVNVDDVALVSFHLLQLLPEPSGRFLSTI